MQLTTRLRSDEAEAALSSGIWTQRDEPYGASPGKPGRAVVNRAPGQAWVSTLRASIVPSLRSADASASAEPTLRACPGLPRTSMRTCAMRDTGYARVALRTSLASRGRGRSSQCPAGMGRSPRSVVSRHRVAEKACLS